MIAKKKGGENDRWELAMFTTKTSTTYWQLDIFGNIDMVAAGTNHKLTFLSLFLSFFLDHTDYRCVL